MHVVRQLHVEDCGMCVVGKMANDVGTAIRKSIVVSLFGYFFEIPSLHTSSFLKMFFVTCFCCFFGGRKFLCREC